MSKYTRLQVANTMMETRIVPIFYHEDAEISKNVIKACYDGGVRVFEFTNRGDFAHEVFTELIKYANTELPGLIVGIGSIVDPATAALYIQLGANFIVSPILNEEMAKVCNRRKILWSPGCVSLSEISKAEELGTEIVKIFPAQQVGGPEFISAIKGPMPWTNIMPTGGVEPNEENLKAWFNAGAVCVGIGSKLITKEIIAKKNFSLLTKNTSRIINMVQKI